MSSTSIQPATIVWEQDHAGLEIPVSQEFGDVYFSRDNGLAETQHVFLAGNQLTERLSALPNYHTFTVGELGFGTGLNVLALWQCWQHIRRTQTHNKQARLHIITTEKFPLQKADLTRALASWPELSEFSDKLIARYPPLIPGCHRLNFPEDHISIDLWLGDAAESLSQVQHYTAVDAWFLDGFAPKCNETLWAQAVLDQIQRLSDTGSTAATFSVAGVIKRGLTERGFHIAKVKGFGRKREMLTALKQSSPEHTVQPTNTQVNDPQHIAIIGAGIAGLCTAHTLAARGHQITLIDKAHALAGASGNPRAMLAPKLTPLHHVHTHLHSISYLYATRFYTQLNTAAALPIYEDTGVYDLLKTANVSADQVNEYPHDFAHMRSADESSAAVATPLPACMYLPNAGMINPHQLAQYLLQHDNITLLQATVDQITEHKQGTSLIITSDAQSDTLLADHVILCTAQNCYKLADTLPQPRTTRGQISWFADATTADDDHPPLPKVPLKYGGYYAPFTERVSGEPIKKHMLGASFIRGTQDISVNIEEHSQSKQKLETALPQFHNLRVDSTWQGRAGLRAQMPDYLPLVGKVSDNVYVLAAMGAKGFSYAPICAELIASQILGGVSPLPSSLVHKLNPKRFQSVTSTNTNTNTNTKVTTKQ